jgi:osmotically-inducible protein OsmY
MIESHTTLIYLDPYTRCQNQPWIVADEKRHPSPTQKSDLAIADKVDRAIWKDEVLRVTAYHEIEIQVENGIVSLWGHVASVITQGRVEKAIKNIRGILGISNHLVQDDVLIGEVASALSPIEQLFQVKFSTGVQNGVVVLSGRVGSGKVRDLAEKTAANNPNVRGVINCVHAPGVDLSLEDARFLQPAIGEQIYFVDGAFGTVEKVTINPHNRRVVGMVLGEWFSERGKEDRAWLENFASTPIRRVVVPVQAIRYLTQSSGFLSISSSETDRVELFDPTKYLMPNLGWVPPFPYCSKDVLLTGEVPSHPQAGPGFTPKVKIAISEGVEA